MKNRKNATILFHSDDAMELPINIVVMLVVGMVALAALVAIIPPPTKNMSVYIDSAGASATPAITMTDGNAVIVDSATAENPFYVRVTLSATDTDGNPVRDASVVLRGLGGVATNTTGSDGRTLLITNPAMVTLGPNQNEGTMDLTISANGFYDYEKEDAVMIVRTA